MFCRICGPRKPFDSEDALLRHVQIHKKLQPNGGGGGNMSPPSSRRNYYNYDSAASSSDRDRDRNRRRYYTSSSRSRSLSAPSRSAARSWRTQSFVHPSTASSSRRTLSPVK